MVEYGFFDSYNGDRKYNSKDFSDYFEGLINGGVYASVGDSLKVSPSPSGGMNVLVGSGRAMVLNRYVKNTSALLLGLSPADANKPRTDAVVVGVDMNERKGEIKMIEGIPGDSAENPTIPSDTNVKYYVLAYVRINANVMSITAENITDKRGSSECPWVAGIVDNIDSSDIVDQYQNMIEKFMEDAQEVQNYIDLLEENGDLVKKVDELQTNLTSVSMMVAQIYPEVVTARTSPGLNNRKFDSLPERLKEEFSEKASLAQLFALTGEVVENEAAIEDIYAQIGSVETELASVVDLPDQNPEVTA